MSKCTLDRKGSVRPARLKLSTSISGCHVKGTYCLAEKQQMSKECSL